MPESCDDEPGCLARSFEARGLPPIEHGDPSDVLFRGSTLQHCHFDRNSFGVIAVKDKVLLFSLKVRRDLMDLSQLQWPDLAALFFFTMASAGFVLFTVRFARGTEGRLWGIRLCHIFGFLGVLFHRISHGQFTEVGLLIISSLTVSFIAFEITNRYLKA